MITKLYNKLSAVNRNKIELIEDFTSHYLLNKTPVLRYDSKYYISVDDVPPRYCDINVVYVTSNYYFYLKYKNIMDMRFIPYHVYFAGNSVLFNEHLTCKKIFNVDMEFDSWRTICYDSNNRFKVKSESNFLSLQECLSIINTKTPPLSSRNKQNFCGKVTFNMIDVLSVYDIIYTIAYANTIKINDTALQYTKNNSIISELCSWLNISYTDGVINTDGLDRVKYNKFISPSEIYIMNYIFGNKNISFSTYTDFLNSNIW